MNEQISKIERICFYMCEERKDVPADAIFIKLMYEGASVEHMLGIYRKWLDLGVLMKQNDFCYVDWNSLTGWYKEIYEKLNSSSDPDYLKELVLEEILS